MNYKKTIILSALVLFTGIAHAQEDVKSNTGVMIKADAKASLNQDIRDLRNEKKEKRLEDRKEVISDLKTKTDELKATRKDQIQSAETKEDKAKIREDIKAEIKIKREERKSAFKEEIAKVKTQKLEARKTFATERFSSAIAAIAQKQVKVQAFLDGRKTQGVDITKSLEHLTLSKEYLAKAQTTLSEMKSLDASTEANKTLIKSAAQKVEESLKSSRNELVFSVQVAAQASTSISQ